MVFPEYRVFRGLGFRFQVVCWNVLAQNNPCISLEGGFCVFSDLDRKVEGD